MSNDYLQEDMQPSDEGGFRFEEYQGGHIARAQ